MDITQVLNPVSKRQRVSEDGEDQRGRAGHRQTTSLGRPSLLPSVTSDYYDRPSTAAVTRGYPAATSGNSTNRQASSYNGLIGQSPAAGGIAPSIVHPTGIHTQWPSSGFSIIHSTNIWPSNHQISPFPHESSRPLFPTATTFSRQFFTSDTRQSHPASNVQHLPGSFAKDSLLECHSLSSQNPQPYSTSPSVQLASDPKTEEIVCFGMVPSISARCDQRGYTQQLPASFAVELESSANFSAKDLPQVKGQVLSENGQMIQGLLDEASLEIFVSCVVEDTQTSEASKRSFGTSPVLCALQITLYGPLDLFEEIGTWFEDYQVFLQDPQQCHRDVRYCNPHRLSSDDATSSTYLSDIISQSSKSHHLEIVSQQPDLLDELSSHDDLEETPQPSAIKRELRRHQKQGLTFMLRREQGWAFFDREPDVWQIVDTDQGRFFLNRVSNASQTEEPEQCFGGIIADPMGLGKTLTMIALAATDLEGADHHMQTGQEDHIDVPTTLVIVPPPLIGTWEEQLSEHVVEGRLITRRHHRETRLASIEEIEATNIVLTTYHTISAEWSPSGKAEGSILYSVRWRRIILDEAHLIRNGNSRMSRAVCALESKARWAVTGTPIQNRLGDLATLFKFIRAHPYTDQRCFDTDISRLWKSGEYQEAIKRLKRLSKCLLLRRDKGTISLPSRRDLQCPVDFRPEERALYNKLRQQAIISIDDVLKRDSDSSKSGAYVNVLQQIESLRLVCNLGLHYSSRHTKTSQTLQVDDWLGLAQSTFNMQRDMGPIVCLQCSSTLDITEPLLDDLTTSVQDPLFFSCLRFICTECAQKYKKSVLCGHKPCCAAAHVTTSGHEVESSLPGVQPQTDKGLPSKVEALITDIKALPPSEKCIVFSTWRLTLDVVEAGLSRSCISSVRFDGKVPQKDRQGIVDRFRHDRSIRVMLLTLSCGAAGLTLTAATRAYLMEPHWNPTLEEQALARIHRIGQLREVTTVRFFVRDSFEQQVIKVQESKRYLAGLLLSPHDNGQASENLTRLQELLSLI